MKEIENRLFLYGKTRVKHVILDKWLRTGGDVDYEWQAKLLMHEILSQPLRQTESNFVGMLANAIADQKDGFEPHFEVYCKLYDCMTKAKEEVREMLDSIEENEMRKITLREFMNDENNRIKGSAYLRKRAKCADGFTISIQASEIHNCKPARLFAETFESLELGYPSKKDKLILRYADSPKHPKNTVYPYVPWDVVKKLVKKHGGIVGVDVSEKG